MPNWCYNRITIEPRDTTKMPEFRAFTTWLESQRVQSADGNAFSLAYCVPEPPQAEETTHEPPTTIAAATSVTDVLALVDSLSPRPAYDWYSWRIQHWGTKWDVDACVQVNADNVGIAFDSAWSPPQAAIRSLAARFPELQIEHAYGEPGCDFGGVDCYAGGSMVSSETTSFSETEWYDPADYEEEESAE